jgi:hypothetical protein
MSRGQLPSGHYRLVDSDPRRADLGDQVGRDEHGMATFAPDIATAPPSNSAGPDGAGHD